MKKIIAGQDSGLVVSRRKLLQSAAGLAGGAILPAGMALPAFADDKPAIGTYPAGIVRLLGFHRYLRAAHRHLCGAG